MRGRFWAAMTALVISLLGIAAWAAYSYPQVFLTVDSGPVRADILVVLGGGVYERPARGSELYREGAAPLVLLSGMASFKESEALMTNNGVPARVILGETKSRTTQENAKFAIGMLRTRHIKSAIIVTTWYHSRRALACFEHYAPEITFYSRPSYFEFQKQTWRRPGTRRTFWEEYRKLFGYWVCYGICPF